MAARGFTVIYSFPYRGAREEWSQQYHVSTDWADDSDRESTALAFAAAVKSCFNVDVTVDRFLFYDDTTAHSTLTFDLRAAGTEVAGTLGAATADTAPGDSAIWVRWKTNHLSSTGKPVYLRKYFHGAIDRAGDGFPDLINASQRTALQTFGDDAVTTGWHGHALADPSGATPPDIVAVSAYLTTRTLKRRGRRP